SAGTGQTALDALSNSDPDPNSVFTRVFIPLLKSKLPLQDATKQAQSQVVALARTIDHDQQPAYYDEVIGAACLSGDCTPAPPPAGGTPGGATPDSVEVAFWNSIVNSTNPADFQAYLKNYPKGAFVDLANNRLAALGSAGTPPAGSETPAGTGETPA